MKKLVVAVVFGGASSEYAVSLQSAYSICKHLDLKRFERIMIGITPKGEWFWYQGDITKIKEDTWQEEATERIVIAMNRQNPISAENPDGKRTALAIDIFFPVLHGKNGEDGTIQGLFEMMGKPYVGCDVFSSALCMDKDIAHQLVASKGIKIPNSFAFQASEDWQEIRRKARQIGYPLFVKPIHSGSSFGISKVESDEQLTEAIVLAAQYDRDIVMEEEIKGFEVGCAVMGNKDLIVGEPDEIEVAKGFFDFTEKYQLVSSRIYVPARISPEQVTEIKQTATRIYSILGCRGLARVDMFLTPAGELVFNEVNTMPGFTEHSRFPNMLKETGISMKEIICYAIDLALEEEKGGAKTDNKGANL